MKFYELTYLITPDLTEEDLRSLQEKVNSFIQEEEGILNEIKNPVKKNLGYPIKKRGLAYLAILNFKLHPEKLANIEKKLKSENQIFRYTILTRQEPKAEVKMKKPGRKPLIKRAEKPEEKKVELEEIEKKLEEILGE